MPPIYDKLRSASVCQEAILRLSGVVTSDQLEEAITDAVQLTLSNVNDVIVYLSSLEPPHELITSHGLVHTLPKEGLAWNAVEKRERVVVDKVDASDPLSGLLKSSTSHSLPSRKGLLCCGVGFGYVQQECGRSSPRLWSRKRGRSRGRSQLVCTPVVDKECDRVIAVIVIVCDELTNDDHQNLNFLEKQLLVCYKRLKHTSHLFQQASGGIEKASLSRVVLSTSSSSSINSQSSNNNAQNLLDLCAALHDQDAAALQAKILKYLMSNTNAQSGFLLLVDPQHREIFCQVIGDRILADEIRFPDTENIFAKAMRTKQSISLEEVDEDQRRKIEEKLGFPIRGMLAVPLTLSHASQPDCNAIACLINKGDDRSFTEIDRDVVLTCFKYTANVLHSTLTVQSERRLKNQTQALLQVAKNLFQHLDDLTKLLREIMQEARNLTKAERCSVFLLEKGEGRDGNNVQELVAKVFDGDLTEGMVEQIPTEVRIPATQGIAGHVATTGKILNIDDAYSHPLFYRGVDNTTGFRTRNILCFPIKNETGEVIGVAQLCNKINGAGFSSFDEDIAQAFSVYCCISIVHSLMYKKVRDAQIRSKLSNELMMHHMQVDLENVTNLAHATIPEIHTIDENFSKFYYTPRTMPYDETVIAVVAMFEDMGFIQRYRIKREPLAKFILTVRRGYRDPPYHNWAHAFAVAHFCYLLYKNSALNTYIDELECFALFVSCLSHDIDHRGTTNSYQLASGSVLASLYSSEGAVLEHHHLAQTMCILNTEGCNIFESLNREEYIRVLDLIKDIILATDLAHHLKIFKDLKKMAEVGYDKNNPVNRQHLLCLLMTSCDLSDQTKNWKNTKKIAELIYQEFFCQGDLEKALGRKPMPMMDRERACIPELQIQFLDGIALPLFRVLTSIFPSAACVVKVVEGNRKMWVKMNEKVQQLQLISNSSMDVLQLELGIEDEVESSEKLCTQKTNGQIDPSSVSNDAL